jgi:arylsulfatase A-like enzyme
MTRRHFLGASAASALTGFSAGLASCSKRPVEPLNALFILCDDLNDSVAGMGGHPQAVTPNIKRLMGRGVQFTNAHSNAPICAPARACLFSGMYPHHSGVIDFKPMDSSELLRNSVSLFEHFKNNGREIFGAGKLYHWHREIEKVFENADGTTNYGPLTDYGPFPNNGKKANMEVLHPSLKFLEDHIPDHEKKLWLARGEHSFAPMSDVPASPKYPGWHGWAYGRDMKPLRWQSETDRDLLPDEMTANYGAEILGRSHEAPFLLGVGIIRPHTPLYAPQKYFDMFPLEKIELPPYKEDDLDDCRAFLPLILQYGFERHELYQRHGLWKRFIQAYLACTAFADAQIGVVLDALESSPYADNTVVVLTGDHGFHMGEKNYNFKLSNWEESTRVPLVIAAPGCRAGQTCAHPVSHVDLYATLIDFCGLPSNPNTGKSGIPLDGHSLRPFVEDPLNGSWDGPDVALIAVFGERKPAGGQYHNFSVRSRRWRYTLYENGAEELYDHQLDPNEWTNLAALGEHSAIKAELRKKLLAMLGRET